MTVLRQVVYYQDSVTGRYISKDWIDNLEDRLGRAKIFGSIYRAQHGNFGNSKSLGGGLFELKIAYGPGYRIYYALEKDQIILVLLAGDKSSQRKDIDKAKRCLKEYKIRGSNG